MFFSFSVKVQCVALFMHNMNSLKAVIVKEGHVLDFWLFVTALKHMCVIHNPGGLQTEARFVEYIFYLSKTQNTKL